MRGLAILIVLLAGCATVPKLPARFAAGGTTQVRVCTVTPSVDGDKHNVAVKIQ